MAGKDEKGKKEQRQRAKKKVKICPNGLSGNRDFTWVRFHDCFVCTCHCRVLSWVTAPGLSYLFVATTKPQGSERQSNLLKVTEQGTGRTRVYPVLRTLTTPCFLSAHQVHEQKQPWTHCPYYPHPSTSSAPAQLPASSLKLRFWHLLRLTSVAARQKWQGGNRTAWRGGSCPPYPGNNWLVSAASFPPTKQTWSW